MRVTMSDPVCLVLCNVPDESTARTIADILIKRQLAACVNILPAIYSCYRWEGKIETAQEYPLLIKTLQSAYPALEQTLQALHPYEVPEIIAIPLNAGLPAYLAWVGANVKAPL